MREGANFGLMGDRLGGDDVGSQKMESARGYPNPVIFSGLARLGKVEEARSYAMS